MHEPGFSAKRGHRGEVSLDEGAEVWRAMFVKERLVSKAAIVVRMEAIDVSLLNRKWESIGEIHRDS